MALSKRTPPHEETLKCSEVAAGGWDGQLNQLITVSVVRNACAMHYRSSDATRLRQALADREADVRSGRLSTIVYIRDRNPGGQEVSGYIDFGHRRVRAR